MIREGRKEQEKQGSSRAAACGTVGGAAAVNFHFVSSTCSFIHESASAIISIKTCNMSGRFLSGSPESRVSQTHRNSCSGDAGSQFHSPSGVISGLVLLKCNLREHTVHALHVHFPSKCFAFLFFITCTFETEVNMTSAHLVLQEVLGGAPQLSAGHLRHQ